MQIFFFFLFVVSVLSGAQKSADAEEVREDAPLRGMAPFTLDSDKQGYACGKNSSYVLKDELFSKCFQNVQALSFEQAEQKAKTIYGYLQDDWSQILEVVRKNECIAIDYVGQRFVVCEHPVQKNPQERIERVIYRIDAESSSLSRKDLLLRIYSEGYRDYTCRAILAKRWALIAAGFCPKHPRLSQERINLMQDYWCCVRYAPYDDLCDLYIRAGQRNVDILYQMIYMQKYGIVEALAKEVESGAKEVFGQELERKNKILAYLKERASQPCTILELSVSVQDYFLPRGILYEVAGLVFSGKAVVRYSFEQKTCTLVPGGSLPPAQEGTSAELELFKNWRQHVGEGSAILQTYLQGHCAYSPEKMSLFIKAFEVMHIGGSSGWIGENVLRGFLKKHKHIPPVWQWDVHMEIEGEELCRTFYHRHIDAIFDMHTRGTLDIVQKFAQIGGKERLGPEMPGLKAKEFLRQYKNSGVAAFAEFLREEYREQDASNWPVVLKATESFAQNIHYNIADDEFSWVDVPETCADTTESAEEEEACLLRNQYPLMGTDCLAFVLKSRGFLAGRERTRTLFSALAVAGFTPKGYGLTSQFLIECKETFGRACLQGSDGTQEAQVPRDSARGGRAHKTVIKALQLRKKPSLQEVHRRTPVVQARSGSYYKSRMPSEKRRKTLEPNVVCVVERGENPASTAQDVHEKIFAQRNLETLSLAANLVLELKAQGASAFM